MTVHRRRAGNSASMTSGRGRAPWAPAVARTAIALALLIPAIALFAQDPQDPTPSSDPQPQVEPSELPANHADCSYLAPDRDKWTNEMLSAKRRDRFWRQQLTVEVSGALGGGTRLAAAEMPPAASYASTIDRNIFGELDRLKVAPAQKSTDAEFLRRVTLDLTGRIPTREATLAFLNDTSPDKRGKLVDRLLSTMDYVDKWTMYFGDLFKNNSRNTQIARFEQGRNAFYGWIKDSITRNKAYDQMARELIDATGSNNFTTGDINFLIGSRVTNGPIQDQYDEQTVSIAETFLGLSHLNCILCHDGRRHLDELSLWGKNARRLEGWEMASFLSRTTIRQVPLSPALRYYSLSDDGRTNYALNTTTGNRPARAALSNGQTTIAPRYIFSDRRPAAGEPYRQAFAREVTADPLFARAAVNYIWAEFFSRGLVEPTNQLDPARLDPDNPPPAPWGLQPSNARLLKELADDFAVKYQYNLRALMRDIVLSEAYQLSSRYDGAWKAEWEPLFARKLVRRLWGEEIHDAVALSSNIPPTYRVADFSGDDFTTRSTRNVNWAMQLPEPQGTPDGAAGPVAQFLDSFFRGNRDDIPRSSEGGVLQALNLMNDAFINNRIRSTVTAGQPSLLRRALEEVEPAALVNYLYLSVLSRYPTQAELDAATRHLVSGNRTQRAENILWTLYNKVDFVFNY